MGPRACSSACYASPSTRYCGQDPRGQRRPLERSMRTMFAVWGVDYLKYDWCRFDDDHDEQVKLFHRERDALRANGRHTFIYSINMFRSTACGGAIPASAGSRYNWSGFPIVYPQIRATSLYPGREDQADGNKRAAGQPVSAWTRPPIPVAAAPAARLLERSDMMVVVSRGACSPPVTRRCCSACRYRTPSPSARSPRRRCPNRS